MTHPTVHADVLNRRWGPFDYPIDGPSAERWHLAVDETLPVDSVSPIYPAILAATPMRQVCDDILGEETVNQSPYASQDLHFSFVPTIGETMTTEAHLQSITQRRGRSRLTVGFETRVNGRLAIRQYHTAAVPFEVSDGHLGEDPPVIEPLDAVAFTRSSTVAIAVDQAQRYGEATDELGPIHTSDDYARSVGFPKVILHGPCTMAMAYRAIRELTPHESSRVARFAVRFAAPAFPGDALEMNVSDALDLGEGVQRYRFALTRGDDAVLSNGILDLRS